MKPYNSASEADEAIMDRGEDVVMVHGNIVTRRDHLFAMGYEEAERRGLLSEYRREFIDL